MGCSGCAKAKAAMAAKMKEQEKLRNQRLDQLPPENKLVITPKLSTPVITPVTKKTPRQIRIEARQARIARRADRIARRISAQKALEQTQVKL